MTRSERIGRAAALATMRTVNASALAQSCDQRRPLGVVSEVFALLVYDRRCGAKAGAAFAAAAACFLLAAPGAALAQSCDQWRALDNPGGQINSLAVYNGELIAGANVTSGIIRWDGVSWMPITGLSSNPFVQALTVYNDVLVVGGRFGTAGGQYASNIASWNGTEWGTFGAGINAMSTIPAVRSLIVHDGALIAGGMFVTSGVTTVNYIARWDSMTGSWRSMDGGMNERVLAFAIYNGDLIAAGHFTMAGGQPAHLVARWDGASWAALPGLSGASTRSLLVYEGDLVAGGGHAMSSVARWNGSQWTPMPTTGNAPRSMAVYNGQLYAGGSLFVGVPGNLVRLDGAEWERFGGGIGSGWISSNSMVIHEGELVAGGALSSAGGQPANFIAAWLGCPPQCYADCDGNGTLNIADFLCFIDAFAQAQALPSAEQIEHYANCTGSTTEPILSVNDFLCFIDEFSQGCP